MFLSSQRPELPFKSCTLSTTKSIMNAESCCRPSLQFEINQKHVARQHAAAMDGGGRWEFSATHGESKQNRREKQPHTSHTHSQTEDRSDDQDSSRSMRCISHRTQSVGGGVAVAVSPQGEMQSRESAGHIGGHCGDAQRVAVSTVDIGEENMR